MKHLRFMAICMLFACMFAMASVQAVADDTYLTVYDGPEYVVEFVRDDGTTVYADVVSQIEAFRGSFFDLLLVDDILSRISELLVQGCNGSSTSEDRMLLVSEIDQLCQALDGILEDCALAHGGTLWHKLPWEQFCDDKVLCLNVPNISNYLDVLAGCVGSLSSSLDSEEAFVDWYGVVEGVRSDVYPSVTRAKSADVLAGSLLDWARSCDENYVHTFDVLGDMPVPGSFDSLGRTDYQWPDTDRDMMFTSSLYNVDACVSYLQFQEGCLNHVHGILQYMHASLLYWFNSDRSDDVSLSVSSELDCLLDCLDYISKASVWNECHPFVWSDGGFTFPCGWDELCHASLFVEHRDKLPGRMDLSVGNLLSDEDLAIVQDALNEVSTHRSYLGALQNGCEYVDMLCNYVLDNGAIIGNQFGVDPGTGSHTLVNIDDAFQDVIGWMTGRRAKLMEQLEWYETLDPDDVISIACIEEELSVLPHMVDLCVDLLNTRTFNTNKVGVEGLDYAGSAEITENGQSYSYKLTYWNNLSPTRNVALVDHIENGDDTCFAGVVTGVDLSDAEAKGIDVAVFALMLDGAYVPGTDDVPDVLPEGDWVRIDPDTFDDWAYVDSLGFYFGDTVFGPELGVSNSVDVVVDMRSEYAARPGSHRVAMPDDGYVLYNTLSVYERVGDDQDVRVHDSEVTTDVVLTYPMDIVVMPETGGPGTGPVCMSGLGVLLCGMMVLIRKCRC